MRNLLPFIYVDLSRSVAPVVLAQDAAGAEAGATPLRGLRFGVWCLVLAAPPQVEIDEVWASIEAVGRKSRLPPVRGAMADSAELATVATLPRIYRTVVPTRWTTTKTTWLRVFARRWKHALDICHGELKAAVHWGRLLARTALLRGLDFLGLGDNQVPCRSWARAVPEVRGATATCGSSQLMNWFAGFASARLGYPRGRSLPTVGRGPALVDDSA